MILQWWLPCIASTFDFSLYRILLPWSSAWSHSIIHDREISLSGPHYTSHLQASIMDPFSESVVQSWNLCMIIENLHLLNSWIQYLRFFRWSQWYDHGQIPWLWNASIWCLHIQMFCICFSMLFYFQIS